MNEIKPIGKVHTDFGEKFGIPRQGALAGARGYISFEEDFSDASAFDGIGEYDYIWVIWGFSENFDAKKHLKVRPPMLQGKYKGVFATRSSFRPNNLGLTCVKLERVEADGPDGVRLYISGVDMLDGTPVYDIKPYLAYADAYPEARSGFGEDFSKQKLDVYFEDKVREIIPDEKIEELRECLSLDVRAGYQRSEDKPFAFSYAGFDIGFEIKDGMVRVFSAEKDRKRSVKE